MRVASAILSKVVMVEEVLPDLHLEFVGAPSRQPLWVTGADGEALISQDLLDAQQGLLEERPRDAPPADTHVAVAAADPDEELEYVLAVRGHQQHDPAGESLGHAIAGDTGFHPDNPACRD